MAPTATRSTDRVKTYLDKCLQRVNVGEKLPSVRQVMRDCGVSQAVVDRVLTKYQTEGLVRSLPRSGFYRAEKRQSPEAMLNIFVFGDPGQLQPGGFGNELMGYMTSRLAQRGESLRVRLMEQEPDHARVVEEIVRQKPPLVATYSIDVPHTHFIRDLNVRGIPCLHMFPNMEEVMGSCLTIHDEQLVRRQVEHLVKLGHRRIAYLHALTEDVYLKVQRARRDIFYRLCLEYGLDVQPSWVRNIGWCIGRDTEYTRMQIKDLMTKDGPKPTALIIYDEHVHPTYAALRECGFTPGVDVSVVGTDDMPWAAHVDPRLTTVRVPRVRAADMICEMMDEIAAGKDPGVRYLPTEITVRQSTCPVPNETK
ncbi:MAG: substrate-binding domain-containing protein [Phycisphaerae bacterium]|nr:substrate-binding domain-containing protein [Phycisphaerae bacterium]